MGGRRSLERLAAGDIGGPCRVCSAELPRRRLPAFVVEFNKAIVLRCCSAELLCVFYV
jgi:hypothetical protein